MSAIPVMLVGNKCDESAELREVSSSEGAAEAKSWGVSFMETSAKTNHNVKQLFQVHGILIYTIYIFIEYVDFKFIYAVYK